MFIYASISSIFTPKLNTQELYLTQVHVNQVADEVHTIFIPKHNLINKVSMYF